MDKDDLLFDSLVLLTDTLVTGFDVIELSDRLVQACMDLLNISHAGILLDDQRDSLRVIAASSEETRMLEFFQLLSEQGPCLESFATGREVTVLDLANDRPEWQELASLASAQGIVAAHSFPMRLREQVIGALNLFSSSHEPLSEKDVRVARVLTAMATIGILNHRAIREKEILAEQLQRALTSRIIIEQAKGVIAERWNVDVATAFSMLRAGARATSRPLTDVASDVASGGAPDASWPVPLPGGDGTGRAARSPQ